MTVILIASIKLTKYQSVNGRNARLKMKEDLQVQLNTIADTIILQSQLVFERPFALPLQHDLMRLPTDTRCNLCLEQLFTRYISMQYSLNTVSTGILTDGIRRQTWYLGFGAQPIIDSDNDEGFLSWRQLWLSLLLLLVPPLLSRRSSTSAKLVRHAQPVVLILALPLLAPPPPPLAIARAPAAAPVVAIPAAAAAPFSVSVVVPLVLVVIEPAPRRAAVRSVAALQTVVAAVAVALLFEDGTGGLLLPAKSTASAGFARTVAVAAGGAGAGAAAVAWAVWGPGAGWW